MVIVLKLRLVILHGYKLKLIGKVDDTRFCEKDVVGGNNSVSFTDSELDRLYKLYGSSSVLTVTFVVFTTDKYYSSKNCKVALKRKSKVFA